jgi:ABC-2 type transport system ATP-binding protein
MIRFDRSSVARGGQLVVDGVSLHVRAGEAWAVIGASGAGKSMLLAAAATAVPLHAGDVLVQGHSVRRAPEAVRMAAGYVPERMPEWPGIRVVEFLELFASAAGLRGPSLVQAIEKALLLAGLCGRRRDTVDALDAGRAKRLLIAKALLHDPQALLFDDPFAGLDPTGRRDTEQLIGDAALMGRCAFAAVDDACVPDCFSHLALMVEGRIVAAGRNDPATFAEGRRWRFVVRCPGRAEACVAALEHSDVESRAVDADSVEAWLNLTFVSAADIVVTVVRAGIPVDAAAFDPPWQAQLVSESHSLPPAM